MQLADVAVLKPLKLYWKAAALAWSLLHPNEAFSKEHIAPILAGIIEQCFKSETLIIGFAARERSPWNPDAVQCSQCFSKKFLR